MSNTAEQRIKDLLEMQPQTTMGCANLLWDLQRELAKKEQELEVLRKIRNPNGTAATILDLSERLATLQKVTRTMAANLDNWVNKGGFGGNPDRALEDWRNLPTSVKGNDK